MRKLLLSTFVLCSAFLGSAQVIFNVLQPVSLEGSYDMEYAVWGATPDMMNPANAVTGILAIVDDGTTADSLGCGALDNAAFINGKIAVVYRGECEFGAKALNADVAGALAVIVINNIAGGPVPMGSGANGDIVDIPVIMISMEDGALLRAEIDAGNVEAFIGNKANLFANDLGIYAKDIFYPVKTSIPSMLANNASEFSYTPAAWVYNYGNQDQTTGIMTVTIEHDGIEIYNEVETDLVIDSGDSLYVSMPLFSQASYDVGRYVVNFELSFDTETDEFLGDNLVSTSFFVNDNQMFANAELDVNGDFIGGTAYRADGQASFGACIVFRDANASRLMLDGIHFSMTKTDAETLDGEYIYTSAWKFDGDFVDLDDPEFANAPISFVGDGEYSFDNGELNSEYVYSTIRDGNNEFIMLEDNVRYIFCAETDAEDVFITFDSNINYFRNYEESDRQPYMMIRTPDFGLGFTDYYGTPAIGAQFIDAAELGLAHQKDIVDITPYPNPAVSVLNIPVGNLDGAASLEIVDVTGRTVKNENVNINGTQTLSVDVTNIPNGTYLFNMNFENGKSSTFRVVINK